MWCLALVNLLLANSVYAINGKCRILALGGNSDRGPYEAGAIVGLIQNLPSGEATWDVVTGNGVGAFNALILSNYALGSEASAVAQLTSFWTNFTASQFYKEWPGGYVTGLYFEHGIFDNSAMDETISKITPKSFQRWTGVGATDLVSGNYVFFNSSLLSTATMATGVKASMITPGEFPYLIYDKLQLVSGSVKYAVDITDGVNACAQKGFGISQIVVDIILCAGSILPIVDAQKYHTLDVLHRTLEIQDWADTMKIVENVPHDYPGLYLRTLIFPSQAIKSPELPYNYDKSDLLELFNLGVSDAKKGVPKITLESQ